MGIGAISAVDRRHAAGSRKPMRRAPHAESVIIAAG
jgi:hypothetical protein